MVNSKIFIGTVWHARHEPLLHEFAYPMYLYAFDLDELSDLNRRFWWFGYNSIRPVSIHDKDYLTQAPQATPGQSLKSKLISLLYSYGKYEIERVTLVTSARYFNYVFNPVSFFYCYAKNETLACIVVEINNTFDERHLYILDANNSYPARGANDCFLNFRAPKSFHVSPFNDMKGEYDFHMSNIEKSLDIRINIIRQGKVVFNSRLSGEAKALDSKNMAWTILRYPLTATLAMPRILWQAARLHYQKRLPVFKKPHPSSPLTIKAARPKWHERLAFRLVSKFFSRIQNGQLTLTLPTGEELRFGSAITGRHAHMTLYNYKMFKKLAFGGAIGFGESFTDGDWKTEDLTNLLSLLIENRPFLNEKQLGFSWISRTANRIYQIVRNNSLRGSKKNIRSHYDLSNDFFSLFLDPTYSYSSAYFEVEGETLESAQKRKISKIIEKARIDREQSILEIGSGWGSLAIEAARQSACYVTSLTLSHEQLRLARERVTKEGMDHKVDIRLCDYRQIEGKYDRIVSVEMLEAVGHKYLGTFFKTCDALLKPDGLVVLQVITMPDQRYEAYRKSCDWIQRHIFPGACIPSLSAILDAMKNSSSFVVESLENIGPHYAPTLVAWREALLKERERVINLGFNESFIRTWDYYFSYCEAAFSTRTLDVLQLVLSRPGNNTLLKEDQLRLAVSAKRVYKLSA